MKTKFSILFYSILFYSMNLMAQLPTPVAPNTTVTQQIRTCLGLGSGSYKLFAVAMKNECGVYLNGYPFTVKGFTGASPLEITNANTTTNLCTSPNNTKIWGFKVTNYGYAANTYTIRPGYANTIWRGNSVLCCPIDTLPGNSPDPSLNLNFTTFSPTQQTYTPSGSGGFTIFPTYEFTITNPYAPVYTVQGISLDMNRPTANPFVVTKCGANSVPLVNSTNVFGTTVEYYTTVYNSDVNKTIGTIHWQSPSWGTIPTILDATGQALASAVNGNYYVIRVAVRCVGSTGSGSYVQGHFKYVIPSTPTASFSINNAVVSSACATPTTFFNCNAITLNNTSNADATSYLVELFSAPSNCGTYTSVYSSGYVTTFPTDLKNLPGTNGTWLQTHTGAFQVRLTTKNACGTASSTTIRYINVATGPTDANAAFKTNCITKSTQTITIGACTVPVNTQFSYLDGSTGCSAGNYKFPMEHNSVSTPNEVGRNNTIFDLTGVSAGTGSTIYTVTLKTERWTGSVWEVMNYNGIPETVTGLTTISLAALLDDDEINNPYYMAFTDPSLTPNGSIYRITVTVNNECGAYSKAQIIKLNTVKLKREANPNPKDKEDELKGLSNELVVYPNPFTNLLSIQLPTSSNTTINYQTIEIIDVTGKLVIAKNINEAEQTVFINTDKLPSGLYFYNIKSDRNILSGKVIKK